MSPLAEVLLSAGVPVSGSDMSDSPTVKRLQSLGIGVTVGHSAGNIEGAGFIIRTAAARDDNVEVAAAREQGIPIFERAQAWGYIMREYKNAICVSGVHGKTTTTSMVTHILLSADADPTVMIGGTLPALQSGYRIGGGDVIVLESCEYYNSYHSFSPTVAVILNVDADHLDFFKDLEDIKESFRTFASLVPPSGAIVCNGDDENTISALAPLGRALITFGLGAENRVRAENIKEADVSSSFDLVLDGGKIASVSLNIPGRHNITNALAAAAAVLTLGVDPRAISDGLGAFKGVERRFEYKGSFNGADIYDDYAHHPNELRALLDAVLALSYKRVILAFQPHTFTRTKALFDSFLNELAGVDLLFLAEIYAAREINTVGISSNDLAEKLPGAVFCPTFSELIDKVRSSASPGDIILTVGAGDIYRVGEALVNLS